MKNTKRIKKSRKMDKLALHFVPFDRFINLSGDEKTSLILKQTRDNRIIIIESYLDPKEQAVLITNVMSNIDSKYSGVEMISFTRHDFQKENDFMTRLRNILIDFFSGRKAGLTIVGPASLIKKIERDPEMIMLSMK